MPEPISERTRQRVKEICRQIIVSRRHDEQIAAELSGHLEDKLLAYLDGREKLTEEDALLLVERHFGDPAVVQRLFQNVHVPAQSFCRALAAIVWVSSVLLASGTLIDESIDFLAGLRSLHKFQTDPMGGLLALISFGLLPAAVVASLWFVLFQWRRRVVDGKPVWFLGWSGLSIAAMALGSVLACLLVFGLYPAGVRGEWKEDYLKFYLTTVPLFDMSFALAWAWWLGFSIRRNFMRPLVGVAAWLIWRILTQFPTIRGFWSPDANGLHGVGQFQFVLMRLDILAEHFGRWALVGGLLYALVAIVTRPARRAPDLAASV